MKLVINRKQGNSQRPILTIEKKWKVLLCDDCPDARAMLRHILEKLPATVVETETGLEFLQTIRDNDNLPDTYDAYIVDVELPDLDGHTITRSLRANGDVKPVVSVTSNTSRFEERMSISAGSSAFVSKQAVPEELIGTIRSLLNPEPVQ